MKDFKEIQESVLNPNNKKGIGADLQKNADIEFILKNTSNMDYLNIVCTTKRNKGKQDMYGTNLNIGDLVMFFDYDNDCFFGLITEFDTKKVKICTGWSAIKNDGPFGECIIEQIDYNKVIKIAKQQDVEQAVKIFLSARK